MDGEKKTKPSIKADYNVADLPDEVWKDVVGYEGIYMVSNKGRVKSMPRKVWNYNKPARMLKPHNNGHGYYSVGMSNGEKKNKHVYIHILVAQAFIPNPRGCSQVNHKDFDKSNNCVENLEWVTSKENKMHYRQSLYYQRVEEKRNKKLFYRTIERIRELRDPVLKRYAQGMSTREIHEDMPGVGIDTISAILELFDGWSLGTKIDDRLKGE